MPSHRPPRFGPSHRLRIAGLWLVLALLWPASSALAGPITFQIGVGDAEPETYGLADLGFLSTTVWPNGNVTYSGGSLAGDGWALSLNLTVNEDPFISFVGGFTNLFPGAMDFTLSTVTPVVPLMAPTVMGGDTVVTIQDADFSGDATLKNIAGQAGYSGQIDGVDVLDLLDPFEIGGASPASQTEGAGLPGPTLPSGAVAFTIGIVHRFNVSAGDNVTYNSRFQVEPVVVPEPTTGLMMLAGLSMLYRAGRPRR